MDTLISGFAEENQKMESNVENVNRLQNGSAVPNVGSFTNKLSKFTLATFDDEGKKQFFYLIKSIYIFNHYNSLSLSIFELAELTKFK